VIFLIQKVDLIAKFLDGFLVGLLVVLKVKLLQVLPSLVKLVESEDLIVSDFDMLFHLLESLFDLSLSLS
jgi:hypothetical protein